jgi:hypothetical protein
MIAFGILRTKADIPGLPDEISLYSSEGYYVADCRMRRHTVRLDGFVSVNAPAAGGEFTTKPLAFSGKRLVINFATSAAGSVRVEIQDESGKPAPGFALGDCPEIYGDEVEHAVIWKDGSSLKSLGGNSIRLRFALKDADLYSLKFAE